MKVLNKFLLILVCSFLTMPLFGQMFDNFIIFGDSLSDTGNNPYSAFSEDPNKLSYEGRWSNGFVWNEYLANKLGIAVPTHSNLYVKGESISAGNTNFSYAGAYVKGVSVWSYSVEYQINFSSNPDISFARYAKNFSTKDLVAVYAGANDYVLNAWITSNPETAIQEATKAANSLKDSVVSLINLGAKNLLLMNLPMLGETIRYTIEKPEWRDSANLYTKTFNAIWADNINALINEFPEVDFFAVYLDTFFEDVLKNYKNYGFDTVSESIVNAYAKDPTIDQSKYVFFDDLHPSTEMHEMVSQYIFESMFPEIPEPAEYAAIFGLLAFSFICVRRFRMRLGQ